MTQKLKLLIPLLISLTACSNNISTDGLLSTASATSATVLGNAVAGPVAAIASGVIAGVAADVVTAKPDIIESLPVEQKVEILKHRDLYMLIETIGIWIILAGVFSIFILPILLGWLSTAIRSHKYKKEMVHIKERLFDNPNVNIRDIKK